ncbi:MAG: DUF72 domain-containing protein [Candidatus Nanopelagicales bacterium]
MSTTPARIGLAGWSEAVSKYRTHFPGTGSGLTRYAETFDTVEVNASFYRAVRAETFASWAEQTPEGFRFSVKINRAVTHAARLSANAKLEQALEPMMSLGAKLAAVLIQLPPTLVHEPDRDAAFLTRLRGIYAGTLAWEPRHPSWESPEARALLVEYGVTPVRTEIPEPGAAHPAAGAYVRLHGTPRRYYSAYSSADLTALATWLRAAPPPTITIFDNTASSAGVRNALELIALMASASA